jgi:2-oxo-4-hydroxy-4-carboxy-5-ureidoimidazoline decarboxylase
MGMSYTIAELNQLSQDAFVEAIGSVYEHTPSIAAQVWMSRPFQDVVHLHQTMATLIEHMEPTQQLALIQAHPDLGSKAKMADASVKEQSGVGLDRLSSEEFDRFQRLNQAYRDKFGFPFIVAVKNHTKESILDEFDRRLQNSVEQEMSQALAEINQIAQFRLNDIIQSRNE